MSATATHAAEEDAFPDPVFHTDDDLASRVRGAADELVRVCGHLTEAIAAYRRTIQGEAHKGIMTNNFGPGGWHADWAWHEETHNVKDWSDMVSRVERYVKPFLNVATDSQVVAAYEQVFVDTKRQGIVDRTCTVHAAATHGLFAELSARKTVDFPRFRKCLVKFLDLIRPGWRTDPAYCNSRFLSETEQDAMRDQAAAIKARQLEAKRGTCIIM